MQNKKKILDHLISEKWLWILIVILTFSGIFDHDLWEPHEYREAGVAYEMAHNKNFIVPHLAGKPFVEKPPLFYFFLALGYLLTGFNAARIFRFLCALWSLGTLFIVFKSGKILFKDNLKRGSLTAALILATSLGFLRLSHFIIVDILLAFFVSLAYFYFLKVVKGNNKYSLFLFFASVTGSFLTKGLIGPLFIFGGIGLYILVSRKWGLIKKILYMPGILFFIFTALLWLIPFYLWDKGGVFKIWFWDQHFGRFTGTAYGHKQVSGEAVTQLLISLFPWTIAFFVGVIYYFRSKTSLKLRSLSLKSPWILIFCWGIFGMMFLSLSRSFRSVYLLPLLPAWALIMSLIISSGKKEISFIKFGAGLILFFILTINISFPFINRYKAINDSILSINDHVSIKSDVIGWQLSESISGIIPIYTKRFVYNIKEPSFYDPEFKSIRNKDFYSYLNSRFDMWIVGEFDLTFFPSKKIYYSILFPEIIDEYLIFKKNVYVITTKDHVINLKPRLKIYMSNLYDLSENRYFLKRFYVEDIFSFNDIFPVIEDKTSYRIPLKAFYANSIMFPENLNIVMKIEKEIPFYPNRSIEEQEDFICICRKIYNAG
ncbi:MAG: glycosyltransferase family 39 protein [Candidatus Aureabacteria bacterium]|nr:glycosyltransferase family 39 protein [Candidatus Auribacterota bacterium]